MGGNPDPNQGNGFNQIFANLGNLGSFEIRMMNGPVIGGPVPTMASVPPAVAPVSPQNRPNT